MNRIDHTLKKLWTIPAVSGNEQALLDRIGGMMAPFCDTVSRDPMGNLLTVRKNSGKPRLLLCSSCDEGGFYVTYLEENGWIRVAPVGGISLTAAAHSRVIFENKTEGILAVREKEKPEEPKAADCFVDIGAKSKKEAEKKIKQGMTLAPRPDPLRLPNRTVASAGLASKLCCAVLIELAQDPMLQNAPYELSFLFSVQGMAGGRGAAPGAFSAGADAALILSPSKASDTPGAGGSPIRLGEGPVLKLRQGAFLPSAKLTGQLDSAGVPLQYEVSEGPPSDALTVQAAGAGVCAAAIGIPVRYPNTALQCCSLRDAEAAAALLRAFLIGNAE